MSEESAEPKIEVVEGAPMWMVTFGDLMALLLCFFVLLLSFSETDRAKYKDVAGSLEKAFGVQRETPAWESPKGQSMIARNFDKEFQIVTQDKEIVSRKLEEELKEKFHSKVSGIKVQVEGQKVTIRLMGETTFQSGKARIREQMIPFLQTVGEFLKLAEGDIIVAGHTDNRPVKGAPYYNNLRLSLARSASVAEFFISSRYTPPEKIVTMGFGEYRPTDTNETKAGRAKNRRVEIILTKLPNFKAKKKDAAVEKQMTTLKAVADETKAK